MAKDRTTMVVAMTDQKSFSSFFVGSLALDSRRLVIQSAYPHKTMAPPFATISKNACMSLISFQDNARFQPLPEAGAQRRLLAVGCKPLLGKGHPIRTRQELLLLRLVYPQFLCLPSPSTALSLQPLRTGT